MSNQPLHRFKTIAEFHQFRNLPKPEHPMISVIDVAGIKHLVGNEPTSLMLDFYCIALKRNFNGKMKYGQQQYDFDEGIMSFISPGQIFSVGTAGNEPLKHSGKMVLIHPDFLWNTSLAKKIKHYEFFDYSVNEALFLSEKEEIVINGIVANIAHEYYTSIDKYSQDIIIAQVEVLLTYAERFYQRQFITRKITSHQLLGRLEDLLDGWFNDERSLTKGLPTVADVAEALHVSPGYLGTLLKTLTGLNTQQHIHEKLVGKAKQQLSATSLTVSEIAYALGFEHPQSFSKLFKAKTNVSPLAFRQAFN